MTTPVIQDISRERALLTFVYNAFNRREIDSILNVMHPEVEWPNGMEGGWVHGRDGVRAYWTRQWGMLDPHVDPVQFHEEENGKVVVDVHQVVRDLSGTVLLDRRVQHASLIRRRLIGRRQIRQT